ncbi:MAG: VCBS repeat-containing protein [Silvibacterium sp.]|nr:VCBS repeat-containing protein [Silvibacterium sp.]
MGLTVADFNGDGKLDVATWPSSPPTTELLMPTPPARETLFSTSLAISRHSRFADFDPAPKPLSSTPPSGVS